MSSTTRLHPWSQIMSADFLCHIPATSPASLLWEHAQDRHLDLFLLFTLWSFSPVVNDFQQYFYPDNSQVHTSSPEVSPGLQVAVIPSFMVEGHVKMPLVVGIRMTPTGPFSWMFSHCRVVLFEKDQEVWFCWNRFDIVGGSMSQERALWLQMTVSGPGISLPLSLPPADQDVKLSVTFPVPYLPVYCKAPHHDDNRLSLWNYDQTPN